MNEGLRLKDWEIFEYLLSVLNFLGKPTQKLRYRTRYEPIRTLQEALIQIHLNRNFLQFYPSLNNNKAAKSIKNKKAIIVLGCSFCSLNPFFFVYCKFLQFIFPLFVPFILNIFIEPLWMCKIKALKRSFSHGIEQEVTTVK